MDEASPDLWALGVQGDANRTVLDTTRLKAFACLTDILDCLCMVLQRRNRNTWYNTLTQKDNHLFTSKVRLNLS